VAQIKLVHLAGGDVAGVPASMSDSLIHYEIGDVRVIESPRSDRCGVATGFGPWACAERVGHREHNCFRHARPAARLCTVKGCGAPVCDRTGCHAHGR